MLISLQPSDKGVVIVLKGRLDSVTSPAAQTELENHIVNSSGPVTICCEGLDYLSSAGLRVLLCIAKGRRQMTLRGVQGNVREVIEISGFSRLFYIQHR